MSGAATAGLPAAIWERQEGVLRCRYFGRMEYASAVELQESLIESSRAGRDNLLLLEHPPVYTIGRNGDPANLPTEITDVPVIQTRRGGDVTYHGPGQLIGYPILDLRRRGGDVHRYLRELEGVLMKLLAAYGISAGVRPGNTGVWVRDRNTGAPAKIASIGIAVRRSVAWHGFSLNVDDELAAFDRIRACGIPGVRMTSIAAAGRRPTPSLTAVAEQAARLMGEAFGTTFED